MSGDMQLSKHFLLSELVASDTAVRLGIDNTPPAPVIEVLRGTAGRMEPVRSILGVPVLVTSGYRCEALERVLCAESYAAWCRKHSLMPSEAAWRLYFETKAHPSGRAIDFKAPGFGTPLEICRELARYAAELGFDQLIHEFRSWAHISWPAGHAAPRRQVLTINGSGAYAGLLA